MAGLMLDPWQQWYMQHALGESANGKWAAFECGLVVPRQNGKGGILEARELTGLFLLREELIIHSAHEFSTSLEAFRRLLFLIESTPELDRQVMRVSKSHGDEGIEVRGGHRIRFRTRTAGGGRGFTADCVILDEAMIITEAMQGAILPTLSSIDNPQVWYTGSAVNEDVHRDGKVFAKVRARGLSDKPGRLFFAEWAADETKYNADPTGYGMSNEAAAEANPSVGIRITTDFLAAERDTLTPTNYMVERLGIGKWPDISDDGSAIVSRESYRRCGAPDAQVTGALTFGLDVAPGFKSASISVAGKAAGSDKWHFEVIESGPGSAWLVPRVLELQKSNQGSQFVYDPRSPIISMVGDMERSFIPLIAVTAQQFTAACGSIIDAIERLLCQYPDPQPEVDAAIRAAGIRNVGDTWVFSRRNSEADISPLVSVTLALWGAQNAKKPTVWNLRDFMPGNQTQPEPEPEPAQTYEPPKRQLPVVTVIHM